MASSLKFKLIAATLASVVTIAALVATIAFGSRTLTYELTQLQHVAVALRNHTNADMMHDAIRADVYAAFYFSNRDPARKAEVTADLREHADTMLGLIKTNDQLGLSDGVKVTLDAVEAPLTAYISSAKRLVPAIFAKDANTELLLADFDRQFDALTTAMEAAGDRIEAFAKSETAAAEELSDVAVLVSNVGLGFGILIGGFALWVTHMNVLSPMSSLAGALQRLAQGDYTTKLPTARRDEIGEMARTVASFGKDAVERIRLSRETRILSELNEWLQSAKSEPELYQMISEFLSRFLPETTGAIYIYANSRDVLECTKVWNGEQAITTMHPDDCWGLRRGRTYTHGQHEIEFDCSHVSAGTADDYCCIPILAHGETVGLLHLEHRPAGELAIADRKVAFTELRRLGLAAVEHISLAIANVKLRDQLRDQSIRDVLTGLYNRRYMLETCRREFQRASRGGTPVAMLSIDVDFFKKFNDNHGHDAGDTVLRAVGEAMTSTFRGDDVPCRFGGEEFVALMPGATLQVAQQRANELRTKIEATTVRYGEGNLPRITISVGVASYPEFGNAPMEVLKAADEALYKAKHNGRNRVEVAGAAGRPGDELNATILERLNAS